MNRLAQPDFAVQFEHSFIHFLLFKMTYVNEPSVIVTSVIFIVLGTVTVLARFYAKHLKKNENGWDDWLSIPALVRTLLSIPDTLVD